MTRSFIAAWLTALALFAAASPASAARVSGLYVADVEAAPGQETTAAAFGAALDRVVVRLTGQRGHAGLGSGGALGSPSALVRRYQPLPGGLVRVEFDGAALKRRLDETNLPVWGEDRPLTEVRLVQPTGSDGLALREQIERTATERGVPVRVVLAGEAAGDSLHAGAERIEDLVAAAGAPEPDARLQGRPSPSAGAWSFRWTLDHAGQREEWTGDAAGGIHGLADRLAARYASAAAARRDLRLRVLGIGDFGDYGRVQAYLRSVDVIEHVGVERLDDAGVVFVLRARGGPDRLREGLALRQVLVEVRGTTLPEEGAPVDLVYRLASAP